jgi:hypothetical protein
MKLNNDQTKSCRTRWAIERNWKRVSYVIIGSETSETDRKQSKDEEIVEQTEKLKRNKKKSLRVRVMFVDFQLLAHEDKLKILSILKVKICENSRKLGCFLRCEIGNQIEMKQLELNLIWIIGKSWWIQWAFDNKARFWWMPQIKIIDNIFGKLSEQKMKLKRSKNCANKDCINKCQSFWNGKFNRVKQWNFGSENDMNSNFLLWLCSVFETSFVIPVDKLQ